MHSKFIFIRLVFICCLPIATFAQEAKFVGQKGIQCNGILYWQLKTLSDKEAKQILNINAPIKTTIQALRKEKRPASKRSATRWPFEKQVVVIRCSIDTSGYEEDGDIHIVLRDRKTNLTMVAEIPNPFCSNVKKSPFFAQIKKAFNDYVLLSNNHKKFSGLFEIVGVPFFDKKHNAVGNAPTMIEIHPVLRIKKIK
jgi:hypothetical protein